MYCPKCGTQNDDNAFRCVSCGEIVQPMPGPDPSVPKPPDYLVFSIVATVIGIVFSRCIGLITGIVAIVFAAQVSSKWSMGDYKGAESSSKSAKTWSWVTIGISIAVIVVGTILYATGFFSSHGI